MSDAAVVVAASTLSKNPPKSRSILGVRSNRRARLFSEWGGVVDVRFLSASDSDGSSSIIGKQLGGGAGRSNRRDFGGISDDGEGSGF